MQNTVPCEWEGKYMITPVIETQRMLLRPFSLVDAKDVYERWTSDERVARYVRWCTYTSVEDIKQWLGIEEKNISSDKIYRWVFTFKETG